MNFLNLNQLFDIRDNGFTDANVLFLFYSRLLGWQMTATCAYFLTFARYLQNYMFTKKHPEDAFDESNPAFSMIADFDGNESGLFDTDMDDIVPMLPLRNMVVTSGGKKGVGESDMPITVYFINRVRVLVGWHHRNREWRCIGWQRGWNRPCALRH